MIKKLRKKFILITLCAVLAALAIIVSTVNILNLNSNEASLDSVSRIIMDNNGSFNKPPIPNKKDELRGDITQNKYHNPAELPFATRFFSIVYQSETEKYTINLKNIASVTEDVAYEYADEVIAKRKDTGWYQNYRYRYSKTETGYILVMIEATSEQYVITSVLIISSVVALIAFAIISLFVILLSNRAVKPLLVAGEKQKQFITEASHELKTPLTVISANAEMLRIDNNPEWCDGILAQSEIMRTLITKMIKLSRLDEGNTPVHYEKFNFGDAVYDSAMMYAGLAESKELKFQASIDGDMVLSGDEEAVRQVTSILVDNAVKYCDPKGHIRVNACFEKGFGKEKFIIKVTNTFADANSIDKEKIFERFYRVDKAHTADSSFGLGLPIAKSIMDFHHGDVKAEVLNDGEITFTAVFHQNRQM